MYPNGVFAAMRTTINPQLHNGEVFMKTFKRILAAVLSVCAIASCFVFTAVSASDDYAQQLRDKGFPESYIPMLCKLHDVHPNWTFECDNITGMNSTYTWSYVQTQEQSDQRNLIWYSYGDSKTVYRKNGTRVESGSWYRASNSCIAYFMDPRNFLDEDNIFQFEKLSYSSYMTVDVVETVLKGTFMANTVIPDSGNTLTYAQYFVQVGKELNISPVQIASRIKQEQGTGKSALISGTCGDTLWSYYSNGTNGAPSSGYTKASLTQYNGYYNYFNIGATGTGYFNIYLTGMQEAKTGGWTTRKAAIRGGASKLAEKYINDYQHTSYYQKFNVHPSSSRNFWGQYMQNVSAAWSESRTVQIAYRDSDLLDLPFSFAIPVYSGMPSSFSDPGGLFDAKDSETWQNTIDVPSGGGASNAPVYVETSANVANTSSITVSGWSVHSDGVTAYQYSIDDGSFVTMTGSYRADVASATSKYTNCTTLNAFSNTIDISGLASGNHNIAIRAKTKNNDYYLVAVITLKVTAPSYVVELDIPDGVGGTNMVSTYTDKVIKKGTVSYTLKGWSVHEHGVSQFQYNLDGGEWKALTGKYRADVAAANPDYTECSELNAFEDTVDLGDLSIGSHTLTIRGVTKTNGNYTIASIKLDVATPSFLSAFDVPSATISEKTVLEVSDTVKITELGQTYFVKGWSVHDDGIKGYEYSVDGGKWTALDSTYRSDVANGSSSFTNCTEINAFTGNIPLNGLSAGTHKIVFRASTKEDYYYTFCNMTLTITPAKYDSSIDTFSKTGTDEIVNASGSVTKNADPSVETYFNLKGWALSEEGVSSYQYSIDGGSWVNMTSRFRQDVANAMTGYTNCTDINSFDENIPVGSLSAGNHTVKLRMTTKLNNYYEFANITLTVENSSYTIITVVSGEAKLDKTAKQLVNVAVGTSVENLKTQLNHGTVTDADGNEITSGKLASGYKLVGYNDSEVMEEYVIIVTGDTDGDGVSSIKDILTADAFAKGKNNKGYLRAADTNNDGAISADEYSALVSLIKG